MLKPNSTEPLRSNRAAGCEDAAYAPRSTDSSSRSVKQSTSLTIGRNLFVLVSRENFPIVHDEVHCNGEPIGLPGYREMLERDFREIPGFISTFKS
jgi:hypothetical protein